jgi:hypothetical protein
MNNAVNPIGRRRNFVRQKSSFALKFIVGGKNINARALGQLIWYDRYSFVIHCIVKFSRVANEFGSDELENWMICIFFKSEDPLTSLLAGTGGIKCAEYEHTQKFNLKTLFSFNLIL